MHKGDYQIIRRRVIIQNNQFIGQAVSVKEPNGQIVDMEISLAGEHNALNFFVCLGFNSVVEIRFR